MGDQVKSFTVLFALESEFNIDIAQDDINGARTVGDIVNYVKKKVKEMQ